MSANVQKMAYTGNIPWHRQGFHFQEAFTAEEAIREAGLDYTVETAPIFTEERVQIPTHRITRRTDTNTVLGVVGTRYTPLQNKDAFGFFDALRGEAGARYETAGVLGRGEKIWLLARLQNTFDVLPNDSVDEFVLFVNSHDASAPVQALFTPVRVVCQNTLNQALKGTSNGITIRHVGNVADKVKAAGVLLRKSALYFDTINDTFKKFAALRLTDSEIEAFLGEVLGKPDDAPTTAIRASREQKIEQVFALTRNGLGSEVQGVRGSLWGTYNALTELADHHAKVRSTTERTASILFGSLRDLKQRAFDKAVELVS